MPVSILNELNKGEIDSANRRGVKNNISAEASIPDMKPAREPIPGLNVAVVSVSGAFTEWESVAAMDMRLVSPTEEGAMKSPKPDLLGRKLNVVNVCLPSFADDIETQGVAVTRVDWKPPAGGDDEMLGRLGS